MMNKLNSHIIIGLLALSFLSCKSSRELTGDYYRENEENLRSIMTRFKSIHKERPFSVEIKDKDFTKMGLEIVADTIRYIYHFDLKEHNLIDTLEKYQFNVDQVTTLIANMQRMGCTWITNLDYYEKREKKFLVFLSLRHKKLGSNRHEKYFTLAFFDQPQFYDEKGRLLDRDRRTEIRKINDEVFYRINDRVCFTLAGNFR